jgi:peroxiredoxin
MTTPAIAVELDRALDELLESGEPLAERLGEYARVLRELNQPFAQAVDRLVERLSGVQAGTTAPAVGEMLPEFILPDDAGHLVSLSRLLGGGPLVLAFRRGHWCPYCLIATDALARIQSEAAASGAKLVLITPERKKFTRLLKSRTHAAFPVLSDLDNGYALSIGLAISVGEEMRRFMSMRGRDLATYQGNDAWMLPIPATFVLDACGKIVMRHVDADYRRRAAIEDILAAVDQVKRTT